MQHHKLVCLIGGSLAQALYHCTATRADANTRASWLDSSWSLIPYAVSMYTIHITQQPQATNRLSHAGDLVISAISRAVILKAGGHRCSNPWMGTWPRAIAITSGISACPRYAARGGRKFRLSRCRETTTSGLCPLQTSAGPTLHMADQTRRTMLMPRSWLPHGVWLLAIRAGFLARASLRLVNITYTTTTVHYLHCTAPELVSCSHPPMTVYACSMATGAV